MKILCSGFNLYKQLGTPEYLLEKFTTVFGEYSVEDLWINHSFSILKMDGNYRIIYKNEELCPNNCGKIIKVSSNDERIILLSDRGKLFKIDLPDLNTPSEIPNILNSDCDYERIINICCGSKITVAYTNKGGIFNVPHRLNFTNEDIADIKCGREHCLLLDKSGNVYSFGIGSRGQLGHGQLDDELEPKQIAALGGIKIAQIAAGGWHSCALSADGDIYTWGWNGNGQLGLQVQGKDEEKEDEGAGVSVMASPHVVDFPDTERNGVKVACGYRHTIVLLDNNQLIGCGWNKYKQLSSLDKENFHCFTYLHDLSNEEVVDVKCGPWNSVIMCK